MSASRTERLLNVLIALLGTRYGYTKEELRSLLDSYRNAPSVEAFERMFERDKTELRSMGFPLETYTPPGAFDDDPATIRYRIPKGTYRLPPVRFTAPEAAMLVLASNVWTDATLRSCARRGARKLSLRAHEQAMDPEPLLQPRISAQEPAFVPLFEAICAQAPVSFTYRGLRDEQPAPRQVQPWGLGFKHRRWYLVGFDEDRQAERTYRLSRICSPVRQREGRVQRPEEFSVDAVLDKLQTTADSTALIRVAPGRCHGLRQRAQIRSCSPGGDDLLVPYDSPDELIAELTPYGPAARVQEPEWLRQLVVERWQHVLEVHEHPAPAPLTRNPGTSKPKSTAQERLAYLVDLVPFLVHHQGWHLDEIAAEFGLSRRQLEADLRLLMVSGLPGGLPGDLMDLTWEDGYVYIRDAEELSEPVRLSTPEAVALLVGLEVIASLPGLPSDSAAHTAAATISAAAGDMADQLSGAVRVEVSEPGEEPTVALAYKALENHRQLELSYAVPSRDEITERIVDPLAVFSQSNHWYVRGWCHQAEAERTFRVDRVLSARLGAQLDPEQRRESSSFPENLFVSTEGDWEVVLLVGPQGQWVQEHYGPLEVLDCPAGGEWAQQLRISLRDRERLVHLVGVSGSEVRIIAPDAAIEMVRERARQMLTAYQRVPAAH